MDGEGKAFELFVVILGHLAGWLAFIGLERSNCRSQSSLPQEFPFYLQAGSPHFVCEAISNRPCQPLRASMIMREERKRALR
jgi:hypothetical protein